MTKQRRTFSQEFKQEAVALVVEHGYSYAAARITATACLHGPHE